MRKRFDYNAHVDAARIMYQTWYPRIDGATCIVAGEGVKGLPYIFEWVEVIHMIGTN